jgi:sugar phosphate isomerase/epimerase
MIHTGLCSITFRELAPAEIVKLAVQAGLDGIEWGGDIHVPHGDVKQARAVRQMTDDVGLYIASYGSYYKAGVSESAGLDFDQVLASAAALGAPNIRVWAGDKGSAEADNAYIQAVANDSVKITDMAAKENITVSYEFHIQTLTDTIDSTLHLLNAVNNDNLYCYWQPPAGRSLTQNLAELEKLSSWLTDIHVFSWLATEPVTQLALAEGTEEWLVYLRKISAAKGDRYALLEFVKDNNPQQFLQDAATLKSWLEQINGEEA